MLQVKNASKKIKGKTIINNISFSLNSNEIVALVGPNGSGKTTLFRMLTSLLQLDSGTVKFQSLDLENEPIAYLKNISFMQDSSVLYPNITGYNHLKFISGVRGNDKEAILTIIKDLALDKYIHKKAGTYSLGMKQSLLLGMSMLSQPKVLLLDEPFNGLDPTNLRKLMSIIMKLKESGTIIFFSSHILSEIDKISDRILFLKNGELIHELKVEKEREIYSLKVTSPNEVMNHLKKNESVFHISADNNLIIITIAKGTLDDIFKTLAQLEVKVLGFTKQEQYSEDIYRRLYEVEL